MKAILFTAAALCAGVGLAVPHGMFHLPVVHLAQHSHNLGKQMHRHAQRHEVTDYSIITDIVTVTAPHAVVWVDQYNNIISTEFRDLSTSASTSSIGNIPTTTPKAVTTSSTASPYQPPFQSSAPTTPAASTPGAVPTTLPSSISTSASLGPDPYHSSTGATTSATRDKATSGNQSQNTGSNGYGICYELVTTSGCKTLSDLNTDFAFLASQGFSKVRVYDIGCDLGIVATAATTAGLQLIAGLNTIGNVAGDIQTLIGMFNGNWGPVDTIVIGNEVVNNGGDPNAVVAAINVARPLLAAAGYSNHVVTVDVFSQLITFPQLCQNSDYCAANAHAYFDPNTAAGNAGSFVSGAAAAISKAANGKAVVITESGWPYQGDPNGLAIPSAANQVAAINSLKSAFSGNPGGLFLFQAYDAGYKAPGALGVEQFFGIYGH